MDDATQKGLDEIAQHCATWLAGLTSMLSQRNLPSDEHERELAVLRALAADRAERMKELWLSRGHYLTRR
jgi:hypothetical protein